jgi:hypothetical protein
MGNYKTGALVIVIRWLCSDMWRVSFSIVKPTWFTFLISLLRIKCLYMFQALLAHPWEVLHKRDLVYCVRVLSVGCYQVWSFITVCVAPPEDEQVMFETCRRPYFLILSFIKYSVWLTTGPKLLPKRFLHTMRSRASSFKWEYPALSCP